jgi:hypothetical protein
MEAKEFQSLLEGMAEKNGKAIKEAVKSEVESALAGVIKVSDLTDKLKEMGIEKASIDKLTAAVEKQGEEMRKVYDQKAQSPKSVYEVVEENKEKIQAIAKGGPGVNLKINKTEITRASVTSTTQAQRLTDVGQLPYLGTRMSGLFRHVPVSPNSNGVIRYIDQSSVTRNADFKAESASKPESAIAWTEYSMNLEKVADSIPVTKEAFNDVNFIASEIDRLLNVNLALKVDQGLWDGDGNTPNLKGVYTYAQTFNYASYTGPGAYDATLYDLVAIMRTEIMNGRQSKYSPTHVLLNPVDILRYKLAKGSDGHYVLPPFIAQNGMQIDQCQVVESSQVDEGTLVVGDMRFGTIYDLEGVTVEVGWVNDQFTQNTKTILAEQRLGLLIRNADATGFLKCANIGAAINAVSRS